MKVKKGLDRHIYKLARSVIEVVSDIHVPYAPQMMTMCRMLLQLIISEKISTRYTAKYEVKSEAGL